MEYFISGRNADDEVNFDLKFSGTNQQPYLQVAKASHIRRPAKLFFDQEKFPYAWGFKTEIRPSKFEGKAVHCTLRNDSFMFFFL